MKKMIFVLLLASQMANAGSLTITCGKNAYEALEEKNLARAEFSLVLKTKGPNNPPEVVMMIDDGISKKPIIANVTSNPLTIHLRNYAKYVITNIVNCSGIDTGSAEIEFKPYVGGFAGYGQSVRAKCSCLDQAL